MKHLLLLAGCLLAAVLVLALLVAAVVATHPWLAIGFLAGPITVVRHDPPASPSGQAPRQVPVDQWPLIVAAAQSSGCGLTAQDLAAIAKTESGFGATMATNTSGHFGYGQFDAATWATYGQGGDPYNPQDALAAIARTVCARGYGTDRAKALNSYGGCLSWDCLGKTDYATRIGQIGQAFVPVVTAAAGIVDAGMAYLGTPYLLGGCAHTAIDCSCLTMLAYQAVGIHLPRTAAAQWDATERITEAEAQPGSLVFFHDTYIAGISHVGIWLGGGRMLNAPTDGQVVSIMDATTGYWRQHLAGFGRVRP